MNFLLLLNLVNEFLADVKSFFPCQEIVKTSQQSTSQKRAATTDENPGPMQKRAYKSLGLPKHKMKASSNIAVKNVTVNVQSSSSFTVNVTSGAASSQVGGNKRAKKVPAKLLD